MKINILRVFAAAIIISWHANPVGAASADTNPPPRLTMELRDSSRVVGISMEKNFKFHSPLLGDLKLNVTDIRSVDCVSSNTAKLSTANDDLLTVSFIDSEITVKTSFGKVELQVNSVRRFTVTTSSTDTHPPNLVALWSGEGDAIDSVGGCNGRLVNGADFAPGKVGQAFSFNGTDRYVEVPDSASLRLTNELTIEFWVKRQRLTSDYIINKGGDWSEGDLNYGVGIAGQSDGNVLHFLYANGLRGTISIADFNWHHCAVTARNGDADPIFYIDGMQQPILLRKGLATINLYPATNPLLIGAQISPIANYFNSALIDEVSLYNRMLTATEIRADYEAGHPN